MKSLQDKMSKDKEAALQRVPWLLQDIIQRGTRYRDAVLEISEMLDLTEDDVRQRLAVASVQTFYYDYDRYEEMLKRGVSALQAAVVGIREGTLSNSLQLMLVQVYGETWDTAGAIEVAARRASKSRE